MTSLYTDRIVPVEREIGDSEGSGEESRVKPLNRWERDGMSTQ